MDSHVLPGVSSGRQRCAVFNFSLLCRWWCRTSFGGGIFSGAKSHPLLRPGAKCEIPRQGYCNVVSSRQIRSQQFFSRRTDTKSQPRRFCSTERWDCRKDLLLLFSYMLLEVVNAQKLPPVYVCKTPDGKNDKICEFPIPWINPWVIYRTTKCKF